MWQNGQTNEKSLVFVQILFRHGNRTPATTFPNDKHRTDNFEPFGRGQLITEGKKNAFELGKQLRRRYGSFLGNEFNPNKVYSVSSGFERTQMSMQCVHAGLFPANEGKQLEKGFTWQPILYEALDKAGDKYLAVHRYYASEEMDFERELEPERKELFDYFSKHAGTNVRTNHHFFDIQNALQVQQEIGLSLPDWAKPISPEVMISYTLDFWVDVSTHLLQKLGGSLVKLLTKNMLAKVDGDSPFEQRKMCLFSGHDMNIVTMLGALNAYQRMHIKYCSSLAIELHQQHGEYFLKFFFQNGLDESTRIEIQPRCSKNNAYSSLDEFVANTKWLYQ